MKGKLYRVTSLVFVAVLLMAMALPVASQEADRPEGYEAPAPTTEDTSGDQDPSAGGDTGTESATFDDFVRITNPSASGDAEIRLDGSAGDGSTQWDLENDATAGDQLQFLFGFGTPQMVLTPGGFLGLGTTSPQDDFHIANTGNDHILLEDTDGASFNLEAGGDFFDIDSTDFPLNNFRIHRAAPSNALVVAGTGVGVGTTLPAQDVDIRNIDGDGLAAFQLNNGGEAWNNGVQDASKAGKYLFSKAGTGGNEFLARERNHGVATVDVEGPVRATEFKTVSSREYKTGNKPVDTLDTLNKLNQLDVQSWQFKACGPGEGHIEDESPCTGPGKGPRHVGPMAEDFNAAFGFDQDDDTQSISLVDANGILVAAVQGLTQELEAKEEVLQGVTQELQEKDEALSDLESRVSELEARLSETLEGGGNGLGRGPSR